jgi:hypothetical protein
VTRHAQNYFLFFISNPPEKRKERTHSASLMPRRLKPHTCLPVTRTKRIEVNPSTLLPPSLRERNPKWDWKLTSSDPVDWRRLSFPLRV